MLSPELIRIYRHKYPGAEAVVYINTLAEAKAECDAVCTSSNAAEIANRMNTDIVLFGPDANLSSYAAGFTKKRLVTMPASGFCPVHKLYSKDAILELKKRHPHAEVMAHPECDPEVCHVVDFVGSTSKMCNYARKSAAKEFIVATEVDLLHKLKKERPDAVFVPAYEQAICVNMKLHTLEKIYLSLKNERYVVKVPPEIAERARKAIEFMLK
jgi:quinolinate synthase